MVAGRFEEMRLGGVEAIVAMPQQGLSRHRGGAQFMCCRPYMAAARYLSIP